MKLGTRMNAEFLRIDIGDWSAGTGPGTRYREQEPGWVPGTGSRNRVGYRVPEKSTGYWEQEPD